MTDRPWAPSSQIAAFVAVEHEEWSMRGVGGFWGGLSLLALGALVTLGGCAQDEKPATAIAVAVKADPALSGLSTVQVRVYAGDAALDSAAPLFEATPQPASELGKAVVLTPAGRDDALVIAVQGLDAKGGVLVENHVRASFVSGRTLAVPVYLASSCAHESCDATAGLTCIGDSVQGVCGCSPIPVVTGMRVSDPSNVTGSYQAKQCDSGAACTPEPGLPGSTCNLTSQCGCKTGERCDAVEKGGRFVAICQPEPNGTRASGQACTGPSQCAPGHTCVGANPATCKHFCETDTDCGGAVGSCGTVKNETDAGYEDIGFKACFQKCSAHDQCQTGCCGAGGTCLSPDQCDPTPMPPPDCRPDARDNACRSCGKASCCTELTACDNSMPCQTFLSCAVACKGDAACESRCVQANPSGAALARELSSCASSECSSACRG